MAPTTVTLCDSRFPPCCRLVSVARGGTWSPATHHHWPPKFMAVVRTLLLSQHSATAAGQAAVCQEPFIDTASGGSRRRFWARFCCAGAVNEACFVRRGRPQATHRRSWAESSQPPWQVPPVGHLAELPTDLLMNIIQHAAMPMYSWL
jgi:hypothetical protein